ncbi:MAG: neutral/alkaline non-lysosomal ceramidase N-terminal domain-containing protein [Polyangia bacterium]
MVLAGWDRQEIAVDADGYAMFGYGMWHHRARGKQTPLHARAVCLRDEQGGTLHFCCLDLGYISHAVREGIVAGLKTRIDGFEEAQLVVTCTHTHSGPGGCSHEALYNVVTPGFNTQHFDAVVTAAVSAIENAARALAPTELSLHEGRFDDATEVAWNRSVHAHNLNPEVVKRSNIETHLAINRSMRVLGLRRDGKLEALVSFFGVHATALGNRLERLDADNKGYAARHAEAALLEAGAAAPVAIFAQATAGDVSPHYHGPGQLERRAQLKGDLEYAYARTNGERQADLALCAVATQGTPIDGVIDSIFGYADFDRIVADPKHANGRANATTSEPCQGVAFFQGTPVDGPGVGSFLAGFARMVAGYLKRRRLRRLSKYPPEKRAYFERIYAAQGEKAILLEAGTKTLLGQRLDRILLPDLVDPAIGELKRQVRIGAIVDSPLVPSVLPLQIVTVGSLALVCMPGEFTTTAGARLEATVRETLAARGITTAQICTYSNDYMGYVTTNEEYQAQAYEGGHTIYGQWTLAAFQTRVEALAAELLKPVSSRTHDRTTRPAPVPAHELALRTDIPAPGKKVPAQLTV